MRYSLPGRIALIATLLIATQASGYLIAPRLAVHETMTQMAYACVARGPAEPASCWSGPPLLEIAKGKFSPDELAVRWPDDPLRKGDSKLTMASLGKDIVLDCPKEVKDANGRDKTIYAAGLTCSSHYGRLQFLHAMASAGGDRTATRRKIQAWSAFAFDVATGRVDLGLDLCKAVTPAYGGKAAYAALADAFEAAPGNRCAFPAAEKGKERQEGMSIRAFFATDCAGRVRLPGKPCGPRAAMPAGAETDALARRAAIGALMHLVQDSYSQSHVARPIDGVAVRYMGPFIATVACTFPVAYFDYGMQAYYQNHSDGDQRPVRDSSCAAGPVADPITASAVIAWKAAHDRPTTEMTAYLTAHVFGPL